MVELNRRKPPFGVGALIILGVYAMGGCGEPLPPSDAAWVTVAPLPPGCLPALSSRAGGGSPILYVALNPFIKQGWSGNNAQWSLWKPRVYRFDHETSAWVLEYEAPYPCGTAVLTELAFYHDKGWAVGFKGERFMQPAEAWLVRYDGKRWFEVAVPPNLERSFQTVCPIDSETCWLLVGNYGGAPGYHPGGTLVKYDGRDFRTYSELGTVEYVMHDTYGGVTYASAQGDGRAIFYVSTDEGETWFTENVAVTAPGYKLESLTPTVALGEHVFCVARFDRAAFGVVKRSGPPGSGEYTLEFLSDTSPHFFELFDVAMDRTGHLAAIGPETSVYFDGDAWYTEKLPGPIGFTEVEPAYDKGFWAIGENMNVPYRRELLYHP